MNLKDMIHTECGNVAYKYVDKEYEEKEPIMQKNFYHADGTPTVPGEDIKCSSCGKTITITIIE